MNTKKKNGSPVGKPTGCDNSEQILIVGGNRIGKTEFCAKRIVEFLNGYAGTEPPEPPESIEEPVSKKTRVKTVYRVTKNGTSKWREVIND